MEEDVERGGLSSEETVPAPPSATEPDEDDGPDDLVSWRLNPNTAMCQGTEAQLRKSRMNICIGRYLSQPDGTMKNGCYV